MALQAKPGKARFDLMESRGLSAPETQLTTLFIPRLHREDTSVYLSPNTRKRGLKHIAKAPLPWIPPHALPKKELPLLSNI